MGGYRKLHKGLQPHLNCKDHLVSGESYEVMINEVYQMLVTSPVPLDLEEYYKDDDYISHTDSKKKLLDRLYYLVRKYTLKRKVSLLNSFQTEEKKVLDIGAGTGEFLAECKKSNWRIFGVEPNFNARAIAAEKDIYLEEDIAKFEGEKFDVITLWHVLEHIPNLPEFLEKIEMLLKKDGRLVIAVPNYKSYDANYFGESWAAYDVPRHLWHFSQNSIYKLFFRYEVEQTLPMKFDAYYVSMLSEKYKTGKTNLLKAFWIGLKSNLKARKTTEYSSLIYVLKNHETLF